MVRILQRPSSDQSPVLDVWRDQHRTTFVALQDDPMSRSAEVGATIQAASDCKEDLDVER
jgi:hypothetical protein